MIAHREHAKSNCRGNESLSLIEKHKVSCQLDKEYETDLSTVKYREALISPPSSDPEALWLNAGKQ